MWVSGAACGGKVETAAVVVIVERALVGHMSLSFLPFSLLSSLSRVDSARARSLSLSLSRRPAASRKEEKKEVAALALYNSCVCHTRQVLGLTQYSNAVRSLHAVQLRRCYFGLCRGLLSSCYGLACTLPVWCVFVCAVCVCPRGRARLSSCAWRSLSSLSLSLSPCCIEYRILWNFVCSCVLATGNWELAATR